MLHVKALVGNVSVKSRLHEEGYCYISEGKTVSIDPLDYTEPVKRMEKAGTIVTGADYDVIAAFTIKDMATRAIESLGSLNPDTEADSSKTINYTTGTPNLTDEEKAAISQVKADAKTKADEDALLEAKAKAEETAKLKADAEAKVKADSDAKASSK